MSFQERNFKCPAEILKKIGITRKIRRESGFKKAIGVFANSFFLKNGNCIATLQFYNVE